MLDLTDPQCLPALAKQEQGLRLGQGRPRALMALSPRCPMVWALQGTGPRVQQGGCPAGSRVSPN